MKRVFAAALLGIAGLGWTSLAATNDTPDFNELRELLRANLPGLTDAELNRAAVEGVLTTLRGRVALPDKNDLSVTNVTLVSRKQLFDDGVAYVRVGQVAAGLAGKIAAAVRELGVSNNLIGVALDLREVEGTDYAAAVEAADLFVSKRQPLLDFGDGMAMATSSADDLKLPLAILVNSKTARAAEALAAALRETGTGLLLGDGTAGRALVMRMFSLRSGQRVSLASRPIRLGNGAEMTAEGLSPDIRVVVKPEEERLYLDDPFASPAEAQASAADGLAATNQVAEINHAPRRRVSEAELLRQRREGVEEDELPARRPSEPEKPVLRDPVLARAVDLLKGLAVVRQGWGE